MALFRSRDPKWKLKKVTDRKGNVYDIPVDDEGYVPKDALKAKFASRYHEPFAKGLIRDLSKTSRRVYPDKMTPEEALQYWKHTNRYDVEGIDAPEGSANYFPAKKAATKKEKQASKKKQEAPKIPPFVVRPIGPRESYDWYDYAVREELHKYMGDDMHYDKELALQLVRNNHGPDATVTYAGDGYYVWSPRADEYSGYCRTIISNVNQEKVDRKARSKKQDEDVRARVEARRANAGPKPMAEMTAVEYRPISESTAEYANDINSFRDYRKGSATEEYQEVVDKINKVALEQKNKVDPMYWDEIDRLVQSFANRYAKWTNEYNRNEASCPSVLISGPSNFPTKKKDRQNSKRSTLWKEYEEIMRIEDKIRSVGKGGIRSDDANAIAKLEDKLVKLQDDHEKHLRINKAIRDGENSKAFKSLSEEEQNEVRLRLSSGSWHPGYFTDNETAEIRRLKGRLVDMEKEAEKRASGETVGYPELDGCEVVEDASDNRIKLIFDDKPSAEARSVLKGNGFRWSPRNSAWQRELNDNGRHAAKRALQKLNEMGGWE